jgi:hypothetical protein
MQRAESAYFERAPAVTWLAVSTCLIARMNDKRIRTKNLVQQSTPEMHSDVGQDLQSLTKQPYEVALSIVVTRLDQCQI